MFNGLVELGEKGLSDEEVKARNSSARLLGLMYEDLLEVWFSERMGFNVLGKDVRRGVYGGRRVSVDFILEKDGRLYAVEAKRWPAYLEGQLKRLTLNNIERVKKTFGKFGTPFIEGDFVNEYRFEGRGIDGKILVWWDVEGSEAGRVRDELKLDGLIPLKRVLNELRGKVGDVVGKRKEWADRLFNTLLK
jgi:hypothetical protein